MGLAQLVKELGWRAALLSPKDASAAGPLYPAIHLAFSPLTGMHPPAIRWVNFTCLLLIMPLIAWQVLGSPLRKEWVAVGSILSVPFLWPTVGMALTELPALVAFTAFIFTFLTLLNYQDDVSVKSLAIAGLAGLCLGISILGRQTYLVAAPAVLTMIFLLPKKWPLLLICLAVALSVSGWLFMLWGGLAPPCYNHLAHSEISIANGVLALSYAGAATLFLNPEWMRLSNWKAATSCAIAGIFVACLARDYAAPPAKSLLLRIFGERMGYGVGFLIGAGIAILGVIWAWNTLKAAWQTRFRPNQVFLFLTLFALVAAPIRMTAGFSSRYIVGLLGVLLIIVGVPRNLGTWWIIRLATGSLIGAATLWTYYRTAD